MSKYGLMSPPKDLQLDLFNAFGQSSDLKNNSTSFLKVLKKGFDLDWGCIIKYSTSTTILATTSGQQDKSISFDKSLFHFKAGDFQKEIELPSKNAERLIEHFGIKSEKMFVVKLAKKFFLILGSSHQEFSHSNLIPLESVFNRFGYFLIQANIQNTVIQKLEDKSIDSDIIFRLASVGIAKTKNSKLIKVNDYFADMLGYTPEEILGRSHREFIPQQDFEKLDKIELESEVGEESYSIKHRFIRSDEKIKHVICNVSSYKKEGTGDIYETIIIHDVSENIMQSKELSNSNASLRSIIVGSKDSILYFNRDKELTLFNDAAFDYFKNHFDVELKRGLNLLKSNLDQDANRIMDCVSRALKGEHIEIEKSLVDQTNEDQKHYSINHRPVTADDGTIMGVLSVAKDISALKNKEKDLRENESFLQAVLNATPYRYTVYNKKNELLFFNEEAEEAHIEILNVQLKKGANLENLYQGTQIDSEIRPEVEKIFNGEKVPPRSKVLADGAHIDLEIFPIHNSKGEVIAALHSVVDVTERRAKDGQLLSRKAMLDAVINSSQESIYAIDRDFNVIVANDQAISDFKDHLNMDIAIGVNLRDVTSEEELERWNEAYFDPVFNGKSVSVRGDFLNNSVVMENTYTPVILETGELVGCLEVGRNLTEFLKNQELLQSSQSRYKSIVENSPTGIVGIDLTGKVNHASPRVQRMFGYAESELIGKSILEFIAPSDHDKLNADIMKLLESKTEVQDQFKAIDSKGEAMYIEGIASIISDDSGNPLEFLLAFNDITEKAIIRKENIERTSIYETLIQNSFDGIDIISYDSKTGKAGNGTLVVRNKLMNEMLNTIDSDALCDSPKELLSLSPEFQPNQKRSEDVLKGIFKEVFEKGFSRSEFRLYANNRVCDIISSQRLITMEGKVYLIRNYREITGRKKQEQIILKQIEDLNLKNAELLKYIDSNLQLENFAYIASHDLKAPIRSVISFMQLLKNNIKDQIDEKNLKFLDIVLEASVNMQVLIDDLLSFSRINTQKVEIEDVDLTKLISRMLIELNTSIEEKDGEVILENMPARINADESRIRQVFQNLITNGLKFTQKDAKPIITVSCKEDSEFYTFSVSDNGIGIEQEYLDKIFLMFKKLHSENKYQGTGIGLSICKKVVEQHEGSIWVESTMGQGSTFYFSIKKNLKLT